MKPKKIVIVMWKQGWRLLYTKAHEQDEFVDKYCLSHPDTGLVVQQITCKRVRVFGLSL